MEGEEGSPCNGGAALSQASEFGQDLLSSLTRQGLLGQEQPPSAWPLDHEASISEEVRSAYLRIQFFTSSYSSDENAANTAVVKSPVRYNQRSFMVDHSARNLKHECETSQTDTSNIVTHCFPH